MSDKAATSEEPALNRQGDSGSGATICSSEFPRVYLNHSNAHRLAEKHPNRIGIIMSPDRTRPTRGLPFVIDNGAFSAWSNGRKWDGTKFVCLVDDLAKGDDKPEWIVVPDVVGDAMATFKKWGEWHGVLRNAGFTLALAVQDGMTPVAVREYTEPDVIFVGGTKEWKRKTLWNWCREFPRVHCGRVNYERWLWDAQRAGCESTDGTGWFRGDSSQLRGMLRYLKRSDAGMDAAQLELEFARTFGGYVPDEPFVR